MTKYAISVVWAVFLLFSAANAQRAEVTISLNESFFDALLDSVYQNFDPPEFTIAGKAPIPDEMMEVASFDQRYNGPSFSDQFTRRMSSVSGPFCSETVKILREANGVRTAVRFREGKVMVPLAFAGNYNPPFVGCVEFGGSADSVLDLEFDQAGQRLIGSVLVQNVNLNGTRGVGGALIAKMIQGSIDKKLNPIEILKLDKISFLIPFQNAGNIRMRAIAVTPEVVGGSLNVRILYEFLKA